MVAQADAAVTADDQRAVAHVDPHLAVGHQRAAVLGEVEAHALVEPLHEHMVHAQGLRHAASLGTQIDEVEPLLGLDALPVAARVDEHALVTLCLLVVLTAPQPVVGSAFDLTDDDLTQRRLPLLTRHQLDDVLFLRHNTIGDNLQRDVDQQRLAHSALSLQFTDLFSQTLLQGVGIFNICFHNLF